MFHAVELGQEQYLSGSIRLEEAAVAGINAPMLQFDAGGIAPVDATL